MKSEGPQQTNPDAEPQSSEIPKQESIAGQEDVLLPEDAMQRLFLEMDELETKEVLTPSEKGELIEKMTELLRTVANTDDPHSYKLFRSDGHFQKLGIRSKYFIQNSLDRDLHSRFFDYMDVVGISTSDDEKQEIRQFFRLRDEEKRKSTLESYAQNGLLTLRSAIERGILKETSATPGDYSSTESYDEDLVEGLGDVRGYEITPEDAGDALFYGKNGFFQVVAERGGEEIDRSGRIPKLEVENRLKHSIVLVVRSSKVKISKRTDNINKEDIVARDIQPDEIDYLITDNANLAECREAFKHLPIEVVGVEAVQTDIDNLYEGPYTLPNYKDKIEQIAEEGGSIWCHIARLPVDTYPESFAEDND